MSSAELVDNADKSPETCPFEETLKEGYSHAVHAMIWAPCSKLVLKKYDPQAAILMHIRFDGLIGFPGGKIDEPLVGLPVEKAKEKATEALIRELKEEINLDSSRIKISWDDYQTTYKHPTKPYFLHFFAVQTKLRDFEELEISALESQEFGEEVMGNFRVPLYTMCDGYRGLPAFLNNRFIGTAKEELLMACSKLWILTDDAIESALSNSKSESKLSFCSSQEEIEVLLNGIGSSKKQGETKQFSCRFEDSLKTGNKHSVHAMISSPWGKKLFGKYDSKAAVFMHMRFDGHLGFPGGNVDEDLNILPVEEAKETVVKALLRELEEEINLKSSRVSISWGADYQSTYVHPTKNHNLHFFSLKLSFEDLKGLELAAFKSEEFSDEVMGNFKVPLYTMEDGYRGLPAFLNHNFIGIARAEFALGCVALGVVSKEYMINSLGNAKLGLIKQESLNVHGRSEFSLASS